MTLIPTTNFKDSNGVDLGQKLIPKDYLISVYPSIGSQIGIPPELWIWGDNNSGQLGNGFNLANDRSTPVTTFAGGTNWKQVSSGGEYTTAIKTDGTLWTWGIGSSGQLGNLTNTVRSTPVTTFAGGTNWKQVDAGAFHMAAIKTDGTLWVWGYNDYGQLGNAATTLINSTPVTTFAGGTNWKQVSCGYSHTAAIKTDGTLWVWGIGSTGRLGNADTTDKSTPITTFAGGTNWKQVSCGGKHTAAIKTDGTLWTWGYGPQGRLGNASIGNTSTPITTFAGGTNWKQADSGSNSGHILAVKTDGTLWSWGFNGNGELGNGILSNVFTPITTFAGGTNWKQASAARNHSLAVKTDGTLWVWGSGLDGELGNGITTGNRSTPVTTFAGGTNWKQVSAGAFHTAAIRSVDF